MTFSELIGALFGWLGDFIQWVFGWVPNYEIIRCNEQGVKYPVGRDAIMLSSSRRSCPRWLRWFLLRNVVPGGRRLHLWPSGWVMGLVRMRGLHWYCPNLSDIEKHHISRMVLRVESLPLETADGVQVEVGMVLTYFISDILKFEVENFDADESLAEAAQGAMQDIVTSHKWEDLTKKTDETSRFGKKLANRMDRDLAKFGVEVETCRPTEQIRLTTAQRLFGINQVISLGGGS